MLPLLTAISFLLLVSGALAATSGASARTLRHEARPGDTAGTVELLWEGEVTNNGVDELEAQVVIRLRGGGGEELQTCRGEPFPLGRLERTEQRVSCAVQADRWTRVEALLVRVDVQHQVPAPSDPPAEREEEPDPEAAEESPEKPGSDARRRRLERALAGSEARLTAASREVTEATAELQEQSEDYQEACGGSRGKPPRDPARCEKLRAQLDRLQRDLDRATEKLQEAQEEVAKDRGRLRDATGQGD